MPSWYSPENFFDLAKAASGPLAPLFEGLERVWDLVDRLEPFIRKSLRGNVSELRQKGDLVARSSAICQGRLYSDVSYELGDPAKGKLKVWHQGRLLPEASLIMAGAILTDDDIEIGPGALVESGAMIKGPSIIGPCSELRQGAYVRGAVMSSPGAIIGHATEAKNCLLMDGAKAGHFAYLGDSVLGFGVNLGAGTKLANLKMNDSPYIFRHEGEKLALARRKFGAIFGDGVETGCNSVANPGVLLPPRCKVMPNATIAPGYHGGKSFIK